MTKPQGYYIVVSRKTGAKIAEGVEPEVSSEAAAKVFKDLREVANGQRMALYWGNMYQELYGS
jgi:hypothetical protein